VLSAPADSTRQRASWQLGEFCVTLHRLSKQPVF
jgi:hypothetical protein